MKKWSFHALSLFVELFVLAPLVFSGKCGIQQKITSEKTRSRDQEQQKSSWIDPVPPWGFSMHSPLVCADVWHFNSLQWFTKLRVEEEQSFHPEKKSAVKEYVYQCSNSANFILVKNKRWEHFYGEDTWMKNSIRLHSYNLESLWKR